MTDYYRTMIKRATDAIEETSDLSRLEQICARLDDLVLTKKLNPGDHENLILQVCKKACSLYLKTSKELS